jgi:hypothetical protein
MQPQTRESESATNRYAPPTAPTGEALRKAAAKRSAQEDALLDKALVPTLLWSAGVTFAPGLLGISLPAGLLLIVVVLIGLGGARKASSTWPRRILYSVPFVTMTLGVLLGPSMIDSGSSASLGQFFFFSMIGALPGLALYAVVRFAANRLSPPMIGS